LEDRAYQHFGLAQRQTEHSAECQSCRDRQIRVVGLTARRGARRRFPSGDCLIRRLLLGSGVMGSGLVVNRPREAESLGVGPDREVDPLVALIAEESESHGGPDQVDEPARRSKVL
jgi:hypothetical protein